MIAADAAPLVALTLFSASIWVGGLIAIFIVARVASATLGAGERVAFFRSLGRVYGVVGTLALLVALAGGAALLGDRPRDGVSDAAVAVAVALVVVLALGMAQARSMTRLRRRALTASGGLDLDVRVRRGARLAAGLRAAIAALTVALLVLASILAA